jgi:branched-chain amino acid transport system permease protein
MTALRRALPAVVAVLLLLLPYAHVGSLDTPGTLQVWGVALVLGALALSYDVLFGFTGLLSFGHALFFASGMYVLDIALTHWHWTLPAALGLTAAVALGLPLVVGAVSLRVGGIAFAMVTLAFAQAGSILVLRDPSGLTGGEEGLGLDTDHVPGALVGVVNTRNLYWLALALLVAVYAIVWWTTTSSPGRVWEAIRENEQRVEVLGLQPYAFKLLAFVLASFLATAAGAVYLLLEGGASPGVAAPQFTLTVLVMVILGGAGTRWGAVVGGILYTWLDHELTSVANSDAVSGLPTVVRAAVGEPLFLLGAVFVLVVLFVPGGVAGSARRLPEPLGRLAAVRRRGAG